eukprot:COSAG01_NODE_3165_length_6476_cov_31.556845_10_plen_62_part_00
MMAMRWCVCLLVFESQVARLRQKGIDAALQQSLVLAKTVGYCQQGTHMAATPHHWRHFSAL